MLTLEKMNAKPAAAALVGDSETDIGAALDAQIPSVVVAYGYCNFPLQSLGAEVIIDSFNELPSALRQISNRTPR